MAWMPVPDRDHRLFTIDEYLALERSEEERHEYLDGGVYAMAGESPDHGRICMNLAVSLGTQLRGTSCEAFSKDTKVHCGPMPRPGGSREGLVEVLSPSTEAFDRGEKFRRYRAWLPTLTDYVLGAQDRPLIDHYRRQEDGTWILRALEDLQAHLPLGAIGCTVPLADVYERIVFPTTPAAEEPAG